MRWLRAVTRQTLILGAFAVMIAVGCVLRFWKLTSVGFWYDELWTVVGATHRPFLEMYRAWILGDSHPPGFFVANFLWFKLVPATEFWARIPHAMAGVATVIYLLVGTRRVLTRDERIMAAALMSLSYLAISYAIQVKQYSLMLLLATIATISYVDIVNTRRLDRRAGLVLCATCVSLVYLNYFATVYAGLLLLMLTITFRRESRMFRSLLRLDLACAFCSLPVAPFLYLALRYPADNWQIPATGTFASDLLAALFFDDPPFVLGALAILLCALVATAVAKPDVRATLNSSRIRHLLGLWLGITGFLLALSTLEPVLFPRYFLITFPVCFILLGTLAAAAFPIRTGWLALLPLMFFIRAAAVQLPAIAGIQRQAWQESVHLVLDRIRPGDRVYVLGASTDRTTFEYEKAGDVDGLFYVKNISFYRYYFRRFGAPAIAAQLEVVEPTVPPVEALADRFQNSGITVYVLAGHHITFSSDALATLKRRAKKIDVSELFSTLVYELTF
jgi:hypothetical protein